MLLVVATGLLSIGNLFAALPAQAQATTGDPQGRGGVEVTLTPNMTSNVAVIATRRDTNEQPVTVNLTYDAKSKTWKSGPINNTQVSSSGGCDNTVLFNVSVSDRTGSPTSSLTWGTLLGGPSRNLCTVGGKLDQVTIPVKTLAAVAKTATLSGTATFFDQGLKKDMPVTSGYLTVSGGPSGTQKVPLNTNGSFTLGNLKPGTYTVTIDGAYSEGPGLASFPVKITKPGVVLAAGSNTLNLSQNNAPAAPTTDPTPSEVQAVCSVDSLTWLLCPVISIAQGAVNNLTGVVKNQLKFTPLASGDTGLKPAWAVFRNLADVFFVLIFFIVIFGTSMGLDNYTVKKILPRLIAAAVLVQFSYLLVGFMVDISNVLGMGIDSLMAAAIPGGVKTGNEGVMQIAGAVELVGAGVGAGVAAATFAPFLAEFAIPLLLALAAAIIGLIAVFITLQIRIMLIDFLIIIAPIAFLLWVLPNTDKYFKMWRETLVKLLLMYPIIVLLLATSKFFSVVITGSGDASNWTKLGSALAPIIALFLIPATFKFAGSALMMGHGFISGHAKRGHSAISGAQDKMKQNRAYNRQQKGLSKINSLNQAGPATTGFGRLKQGTQRKLAQQQAGLSIDKIDPNRMAGALEKNDKDQLTAAGRLLENDNPSTLLAKALDTKSSQFTSRAATAKLAAIEDTGKLQTVLANKYGNDTTNSEWIKATAGNFSGLKEKAPHLVSPGGAAAYDNIKAEKGVRLDNVGAQAMVNRRNALKAAHVSAIGSTGEVAAKQQLDAFDENMRNVVVGINGSTTGVNNINNDTRDTLNQLGTDIGVSVHTPVEKANLLAAQRAGGAVTGSGPVGGGSGPSGSTPSGGGSGTSAGGSAPAASSAPSGVSAGPAPTQNIPYNQNTSPNPNAAQARSGVSGGWSTQPNGLVIPTTSVNPNPNLILPNHNPSSSNAYDTNVTINVPGGGTPEPAPTTMSPPATMTWRTAPNQGSSVTDIPNVTSERPSFTLSERLKQSGGRPDYGTIILPTTPGSRTNGPSTSLRLAPRDQTNEPGDDRSIN